MKSITVEAKIENVDKVTEFVNEVLEEKDFIDRGGQPDSLRYS